MNKRYYIGKCFENYNITSVYELECNNLPDECTLILDREVIGNEDKSKEFYKRIKKCNKIKSIEIKICR